MPNESLVNQYRLPHRPRKSENPDQVLGAQSGAALFISTSAPANRNTTGLLRPTQSSASAGRGASDFMARLDVRAPCRQKLQPRYPTRVSEKGNGDRRTRGNGCNLSAPPRIFMALHLRVLPSAQKDPLSSSYTSDGLTGRKPAMLPRKERFPRFVVAM